jgi:anthranilate synthase component 2
LLGVCLGHQAIGQYFGGKVVRGGLMHGKTSPSRMTTPACSGHPSPFIATRYHSLIVRIFRTPACQRAQRRWACHGLPPCVLPIHGVQFHPESIATEHGHAMLANFLRECGMTPVIPMRPPA